MISPPCRQDHFTDRGDIWGFNHDRYKVAFHWTECSVNLMDVSTGLGVFWVRTTRSLPFWVHASPLRTMFHWWMESRGCQLLHAAAVGTADGSLLITGRGGVGKSTTALTCLAEGMDYLADDYLIVALDPEPTVHSLYNTAKLNADQLRRFPQFAPYVTNQARLKDEKAVMFLHPDFSGQMPRKSAIRAIATPSISGQPATRFKPTSHQHLRRAAAFTTLSQLPYAGENTHRFIDRLVDSLPGLELSLGNDFPGIADQIVAFLGNPTPVIDSCTSLAGNAETELPPLITVIIPVHNGAAFIADAIANVVSQNYPALEIIVVDDGSTDNVEDVVSALPTDVRFLQQENLGAAAARNRGIRDASGDYVAFLDVDDLWPEQNLVTLLEVMRRKPALEIVHGYGQLMERDDSSDEYSYVGNPLESYPYYIGAALYRRSAFERVGLFDTDLDFSEDSDWYTRAAESGLGIERLDQVTLFVRRHESNMTRDKSLVELGALRVLKKALDRKRAAQNKSTNAPPDATDSEVTIDG
jgi:hypothetical protein